MKTETKNYLSIFGLLYCSIMLGTHYIITKQISMSVDVAMLTAYRFLIALVPLYIYLIYTKKNPFYNIKPGLILGFFLWLVFILISVGLRYTSAINTGFISGLFFIFVPLVSYFIFKSRPQLSHLLTIIISLFGIYLLTGGLNQIGFGDGLILLSAIFTAIHLVLVGYFSKQGLDPFIVCFQQFFVVFILSVVFAIFSNKFSLYVPTTQIPPLLFLGLLPTLSVFFVQMVSLKYSSEIMAAILLSLQPGFAAFFAYWMGGEKFTLNQLFGGVLLFLSAMVCIFLTRKKEELQNNK